MNYITPEDCVLVRKIQKSKNAKGKYKCPDCSFRSKSLKTTTRHYDVSHISIKRFSCASCDYQAYLRSSIKYHIHTRHMDEQATNHSSNSLFAFFMSQSLMELTAESNFQNQTLSDSTLTQSILETKDERGRYSCLKCDVRSKSLKRLKIHFDLVHMNERNFECASCDYKASLRSTIRTHILSKHMTANPPQRRNSKTRKKLLKCDKCPFTCAKPSTLKRHKEKFVFHSPSDRILEGSASNAYACPRCNFRTIYLCSVMRHYNTHKVRRQMGRLEMACTYCEFKTIFHRNFVRHMRSEHSVLKPYKCDQCPHETGVWDSLKRHVNKMHSKVSNRRDSCCCVPREREPEGKVTCPNCEFRSDYYSSLWRHFHVLHSDEKWYYCSLCGFKAKRPNIINDHANTKHGGKGKPLACSKGHFMSHVKAVHSRNQKSIKKQKERLPKRCVSIELDGTYTCTLCNFLSNDVLCMKRHLFENHPGCVEFTCYFCGFKTGRRTKMKHHLNVKHSAKKLLKCDKCVFTCGRLSQLKNHALRRHMERGLECPFSGTCAFKTRRVASLKRHITFKHASRRAGSGVRTSWIS